MLGAREKIDSIPIPRTLPSVETQEFGHDARPARRGIEMTISRILLLKGAIWTVVAFGITQFLRLTTNVILARLLAPELFGIMQVVYSLRTGVELISDVGISQNIVYNKDANEPDFYNTAWSVQLIRSVLLWFVFSAAAVPAARFYHSPILVTIIPIAAFAIVLGGLSSTSRFLLQKRMKYGTLTTFDAAVALVSSAGQVVWAYFNPTIWALVLGPFVGLAALTIGSHFIMPGVRQRFYISRRYVAQILSFGKWIFASSIIYFLSTNFDRLYLAKTIPLALLGVYGIARTLSELSSTIVLQLGSGVIFPFVASHSHMPRTELRAQLAPIRLKFLLAAGVGFSLFAATADLAIGLLYDQRYRAASWMLPILIIGSWFSILSNLNESTLLGLGRPNYSFLANGGKFAFLLIGLTLSVAYYGVPGGVMAVAGSDLCRYVPILFGQVRERFSFGRQDLLATLAVFALIALWEWLRWLSGFGTSFDTFL
jgi:O-antigen/teichoic acid export membrane protein